MRSIGELTVLTHDEVIWGYRYILGRDPESDAVVSATAAAVQDVPSFRRILLRSAEFERLSIQNGAFWLNEPRWVAAPVFGGARLLWLDLSDRFVSLGCLQDQYEIAETRFLRGVLKPGDVFIDVGANVGWYTMLASTVIGESGHVHAFEPRRPIVDYLQRTAALNGLEKLISIYPIGLSNEVKSETLMWSAGSSNGGGASFARDDISMDMVYQAIEVQSLDSLNLGHVDVIKIDVEGAEPLVAEGAKATIESYRPIILTEVLPSQLQRVCGCSPESYFNFFLSRRYSGYIVDGIRCGERVSGFPEGWDKELVNIGFIPNEASIDFAIFSAN
jgi:FkbM family methyltransferase